MRAIAKGAEPPSLTAHRQSPPCDYDNYADKATLRLALASEQRGLCCYCMDRIRPNEVKIEHWRCQSRFPDEQLTYRNLLGACSGGEGLPPMLQHCDVRKRDRDLRWNPADPAHHVETRVYYELDGSIRSRDDDFDVEMREVLNLNLPLLRNHRRGVLDAVLAWWRQEKRQGRVPRARFERERRLRLRGNGELEPFSQVAVWWLDQRLAGMQA